MQCDNAKILDVRDNGMVVGQDIICTIKNNKVIGGFRSTRPGFDLPDCYRFCEKRVMNGIFINKE